MSNRRARRIGAGILGQFAEGCLLVRGWSRRMGAREAANAPPIRGPSEHRAPAAAAAAMAPRTRAGRLHPGAAPVMKGVVAAGTMTPRAEPARKPLEQVHVRADSPMTPVAPYVKARRRRCRDARVAGIGHQRRTICS